MDKIELRSNGEQGSSPFWDHLVLPLLRYKRLSYAIVSSTLVVALTYCLLVSNQYSSTAKLLPSGAGESLAELKDLAAGSLGGLGMGTLNQASEYSSALYPKILGSRYISERILKRKYDFSHDGERKSMTLEEYLEEDNIDKALIALGKVRSTDLDRRTGLVTVSVTTRYPDLSAQVVNTMLDELDDYNVNHRRSKASENAKFVGQRLVSIKAELEAAEDSLVRFKQRNRNYAGASDPTLQVEIDRLDRSVTTKSALHSMMVQQYETARIEAVKDIPIVRILDRGSIPLVKTRPRRSVIMIMALIGSLIFSALLSLCVDTMVKRSFRRHLQMITKSPGVQMGRWETKVLNRMTSIVGSLEQENKT